MTRLSASAVPRALACPASLVLPQHRYATTWADQGEDRHADTEAAIDVGHAEDVLPAEVVAMLQPGDKQATECAFAYDCATDTARELGHRRREYGSLAPYEIGGTIDLLILGNGRAIVVDKKGYERVGAAETNGQTLTYALMVARTYGLDEVTVVIFYEIGAPDIAAISAMALDNHAARLKRLHVDVARAKQNPAPFLTVGMHCKYCEAFLSCPKQQAFQLEVTSADSVMRIESGIPFERDEDAAAAFDLLGRIKMLTARISAALYARANERPIPLSNGNVFGPREKSGNEKIDGDVAYEVVREMHGQRLADAAVERKATKTRLKAALKGAGVPSVASAERAVLAEIRKRGGVEQSTKIVLDEHPPEKVFKEVG